MNYLDEQIIFTLAQNTFVSNDNRFGYLIPLITVSGERIDRHTYFPSNGCCWWMVRGTNELINSKAGRLLVGTVEPAVNPEKCHYQAALNSVIPAGRRILIEILTVFGKDVSNLRDLINKRNVITLDHQPTTSVLIRWENAIYGPFQTDVRELEDSLGRYTISFNINASQNGICKFHEEDFKGTGYYKISESITDEITPYEHLADSNYRNCEFEFILMPQFDQLRNNCTEVIDIKTDHEILSVVSKAILTRKSKQKFLSYFQELQSGLDNNICTLSPDDTQVFESIKNVFTKETSEITQVIAALIESDELKTKIDAAIIEKTQEMVKEKTNEIRSEAEDQIKGQRQKLDSLNSEVKTLQTTYDRKLRQKKTELEKELEKKRKTFHESLEEDKKNIESQKAELIRQQDVLQESLEQVVKRMTEGKDDLLNDFLALQPIYQNLGLFNAHNTPAPDSAITPPDNIAGIDRYDPALNPPSFVEYNPDFSGSPIEEEEFFDRFEKHVVDCGFRYKKEDLIAFHLSVKCGEITVLGGSSGTGKSSLPKLYSQALSGSNEEGAKRFLPVDVNPTWTNGGDLLGYFNIIDGRYQPSSTGLFQHLLWSNLEMANKGDDSGLYLVCLDEMNLAQVEHYFSGFMQELSRAPDEREISIFDPSCLAPDDPFHKWSRLALKQNLRFVGTVNFDETTKQLSHRMLDRSNLLQIEAEVLQPLEFTASTNMAPVSGKTITLGNMQLWVKDRTLDSKSTKVLQEIQEPLMVLGSPITPRRHAAIAKFLASANGICKSDLALDLQITQRILPQIGGLFRSESQKALDSIQSILDRHEYPFSKSMRAIDKLRQEGVSSFFLGSSDNV